MVFGHDCTRLILEEFPEFKQSEHWKGHCEFWKGAEAGIGSEMSVFSEFVTDNLNAMDSSVDFKKVFLFIEKLMVEGDQDVKDVAATCFLENLINFDSWGTVKASSFIPYLGPKSREYCIAWDEFTGVKTEGLYD